MPRVRRVGMAGPGRRGLNNRIRRRARQISHRTASAAEHVVVVTPCTNDDDSDVVVISQASADAAHVVPSLGEQENTQPLCILNEPLAPPVVEIANNNTYDNPHTQSLQDPAFLKMQHAFEKKLHRVSQVICDYCKERHIVDYKAVVKVCKRCRGVKARRKFLPENNMDPGPKVPELSGLTTIEQLLIAQVVPSMSIFRLPRGGQYGFKGHVLNVPQDLHTFVTQLPRRVGDLDLLVLTRGEAEPNLPPHIFTVNRQRVLKALTWLQQNNEFYRHINIVQENVDELPENGIIHIPANQIHNDPADEFEHANVHPNCENPEQQDLPLPNTFVPQQLPGRNERDVIRAALENNTVIPWPNRINEPINEFNTVG